MSTVAFSRLIEAPADELWRVFTDLPGRPGWLCQVEQVEVLAQGPGEHGQGRGTGLGVGTVWRESRTGPDGRVVVEQFAVREASAPRRLVVGSSGDGVDYLTTYTFAPVPAQRRGRGRTVVTVTHEGVPTGRYGRLLAVVLGGLAARAGEGALRRDLADLAATATAAGPGQGDRAVAA
ncbi:SRPBCC domain-containing protein [Micromonospora sp. WMMD1102]|uniref:SRPBCC family protein n=1 Tax=Micromonospora sp. WMMD1102 TaxID=3016105 RepID=UPI0024155319|nr:SRPBCC domain-containing protein [Micromonospora sp. WMMD1102]MDG4791370.1 SRPBCC domain-containing protein [Micromonospora sp. WMMD1102]